jgi:hypothetical protein
MPDGLDVTVPVPLPFLLTVRILVKSVKVAVTLLATVIDTVQGVVVVPEQPPPDQPVKVEPVPAVAVRTTLASASYSADDAEHVVPQLMPARSEATVPVPLPALVTFRAYCPTAQVPPELAPAVVATLPPRQVQVVPL